jgi:calcineurin-like phosphoesterase family protein
MAHWYTADPHFGHDNIIKFCSRPFRNVAAMDAALTEAYRACVGPDDDLWIIGDFVFGPRAKDQSYLARQFARLPGRKHLIFGNHDGEATRALPWASAGDMAQVKDGDHDFVLCHYPMITWDGARRGAIQLFGHVHRNWEGTRNSVNVGVDLWDYRPVRASEIVARAHALPVNLYWDQVEPRSAL